MAGRSVIRWGLLAACACALAFGSTAVAQPPIPSPAGIDGFQNIPIAPTGPDNIFAHPPPPAPARVLRLAPRTGRRFEMEFLSEQKALLVTGGVILTISNVEHVGILDIEADNVVIWTKGDVQKFFQNMQGGQGESTNENEFYMSGDKKGDQGDDKKNDQKKDDQSSKDKSEQQKGSSGSKSSSNAKSQPRKQSGKSSRGPMSISSLGTVGKIIKWVVFGILALVVGYFLFRHGLKFLANFTTWAKQLLDFLNNFWARLFGGEVKVRESDVVEDFANVTKPARPFAEFQNPFDTGEARRLTPDQLVKYSFAALEAWAWEHDKSRDPQETPLEFACRLGEQYESLETHGPRLGALYARLAYARGALPDAARQHVAEFWRHLELAQDEAHGAGREVEVE